MRKFLTVIAILSSSLLSGIAPSHAGLVVKDSKGKTILPAKQSDTALSGEKSAKHWRGRWSNRNGATLMIHDEGTLISVTGTDAIAVLQFNCLPKKNWASGVLECVGTSKQLDGKTYIYKSQLSLKEEGIIKESWHIRGLDESNSELIETSGEEEFQKSN